MMWLYLKKRYFTCEIRRTTQKAVCQWNILKYEWHRLCFVGNEKVKLKKITVAELIYNLHQNLLQTFF